MRTPALPGDVLLSKYRIERLLGQGGMGFVFAAKHLELGQLHAIKFLLPDDLEDHDARERFLREARAAAQVKGEHVVRVHDVGRMEDGTPYMIMEYLDGYDLKVLLARQGPLPLHDAVTYVLHACDAIIEAHAKGIIHRDLKPANLFVVRRHDGSAYVKVLDFGISKITQPEEVDLTTTNMALGSTPYMSPEQMRASKTVDGRTDIWALGVILYELLTGSSPFYAGSKHEIVAKVLQDDPRPLRQVRPEVPEGLARVVMRCLSKERDARFATIELLALALKEFVPPPPRFSTPSVTNLENASATTTATKKQAPMPTVETTRMPAATPPGTALGEPTSITFSQTGKPKVVKRRRSGQIVAFFATALILICGGWVGWQHVATREATLDAMVSASSDAITSASTASTGSSSHVVIVPTTPAPTNTQEGREDPGAIHENGFSGGTTANAPTEKPINTPKKLNVAPVNTARTASATTATAPTPAPTTTATTQESASTAIPPPEHTLE